MELIRPHKIPILKSRTGTKLPSSDLYFATLCAHAFPDNKVINCLDKMINTSGKARYA